jgi:MFS family permease
VTKRRRGVLAIGGGAHFVHDGFSDAIYVLLPLWAQEFGLSHAQVGLLKSAYASVLAGVQLPAGLAAERVGERFLLAAGTAVAGLGFVLIGSSVGVAGLIVCLLLAGAGSGTQHPLASSLVSRAFQGGRRRAALGTYNFAGDLGKMVFPTAVAAAAAWLGWRTGVIGFGVVGIAAGVAIYVALVGFRAAAAPMPARPRPGPGAAPAAGWGIHDAIGFAALSATGIVDSAARLAFLTFVPFLLIDKGAAVELVGFSLTLVFAGGAAGKLACGLIAERVGIIRTVVLTELMTGLGVLVLLLLPLLPALLLLPLLGVALNGTSSVLYGSVGEFVDADRQARAFGLFYTMTIGSGAVAPFLFGVVSDGFGVHAALAAIGLSAFLALPLCFVLGPRLRQVAAGHA